MKYRDKNLKLTAIIKCCLSDPYTEERKKGEGEKKRKEKTIVEQREVMILTLRMSHPL